MMKYKIVKRKEKYVNDSYQNNIIRETYYIIKKSFCGLFWFTMYKDVCSEEEIIVFDTLKDAKKFIRYWKGD